MSVPQFRFLCPQALASVFSIFCGVVVACPQTVLGIMPDATLRSQNTKELKNHEKVMAGTPPWEL